MYVGANTNHCAKVTDAVPIPECLTTHTSLRPEAIQRCNFIVSLSALFILQNFSKTTIHLPMKPVLMNNLYILVLVGVLGNTQKTSFVKLLPS